MSDEAKLSAEYARSLDAKALLDNPLLIEAFAAIEKEIETEWKQSKANDADAREKLYLMNRLLLKLRGHIQVHVQTGKLAERQLANIRDKKTWFGMR